MFQIAALLFFPRVQPRANFHHYFRVLAAIVFCSVPATSLTFWMWVKRARSQLLQSEGTEAMSSLNQMWYRSIRGSASQGWSCWHTKRTLEQLWTPRSLRELCKTSQIHSFTWASYLFFTSTWLLLDNSYWSTTWAGNKKGTTSWAWSSVLDFRKSAHQHQKYVSVNFVSSLSGPIWNTLFIFRSKGGHQIGDIVCIWTGTGFVYWVKPLFRRLLFLLCVNLNVNDVEYHPSKMCKHLFLYLTEDVNYLNSSLSLVIITLIWRSIVRLLKLS